MLKKLKVRPEETIFIDDKKRFADAARRIGIKAIWFRNIGQLRKDLLRYGVHGI